MLRKPLRIALTALALAGAAVSTAHADIDDELDELRGSGAYSDWQQVKHDQRRNIRA